MPINQLKKSIRWNRKACGQEGSDRQQNWQKAGPGTVTESSNQYHKMVPGDGTGKHVMTEEVGWHNEQELKD